MIINVKTRTMRLKVFMLLTVDNFLLLFTTIILFILSIKYCMTLKPPTTDLYHMRQLKLISRKLIIRTFLGL